MFHKKNKSHSLAFNAGSPRVVANRPALLAGRCGNLPAPLFRRLPRAARNFRIIIKTLRSWRLCVRLIKSPHSGNSNTLMLKTIAASPALAADTSVASLREKNIPALQGKELFRIVSQKKQIPLVGLQRRSSTCRCELRAPFRQCGNLPVPSFRSCPQSSPELQNHYKNFAAFAALREINQAPSLRQQHVYVKKPLRSHLPYGKCKWSIFA